MTGSTKTARFGAGVTIGVVTAVTALTFLSSQESAFARASRTAVVGRIESPLGLQGTRGAGGNVGVIFNLVDATRRKSVFGTAEASKRLQSTTRFPLHFPPARPISSKASASSPIRSVSRRWCAMPASRASAIAT